MGNCITPLRRAIRTRDPAKVREILEEAGDGAPDLINEDYSADCFIACCLRNPQNPLHTAVALQETPIILELLKFGADVNSSGREGATVLHKACRQNNVSLCKLLVEYGADCHLQDNTGWYPIHCASMSLNARQFSDKSALLYILEIAGSADDIHLKDFGGNTPLHVAAKWDNIAAFQYLVQKGADLSAVNAEGKKALELCDNPDTCAKITKSLQI